MGGNRSAIAGGAKRISSLRGGASAQQRVYGVARLLS